MSKEYTDNELKMLSNEEIKKLFFDIRSRIININNDLNQKRDMEIYLCYIERELEKRSI